MAASKSVQAAAANECKATELEPAFAETMRHAPEDMHMSGGEAARFLSTVSGLAPEGSIRKYLAIYRARGHCSRFFRLYRARPGPALTRHNRRFPDAPGIWINRLGLPEPAEPDLAPKPVPKPAKAEPAPPEPEPLLYWPEGQSAEGIEAPIHRNRLPNDPALRVKTSAEQHESYDPYE